MEGTNVMSLSPQDLEDGADAAVCDLSFRSIRGAARHILDLVALDWLVALVKPQFEWQSPPSAFRGVVTEPSDRASILRRLLDDLGREGVNLRRIIRSPLRGRKGNVEFLALLGRRSGDPEVVGRELEMALSE
jgi:23S rRNA (cytidine1920-2'-O)/16S rRNA (cytidine1409-2'-O)-methyltransferase